MLEYVAHYHSHVCCTWGLISGWAVYSTVAQGTFYGLIFYANIIQVNATIFFNQSVLSPLQVLISLLNLDLGLPLCFYDGMDDAAKTGLQFVFPAYLLSLTLTVIVICHYCLRRNTENVSCFNRLNYLIGQRAVGVLCTPPHFNFQMVLFMSGSMMEISSTYMENTFHCLRLPWGSVSCSLHPTHLLLPSYQSLSTTVSTTDSSTISTK